MGLFRKKCHYCRQKINKGKEYYSDIKVPHAVGTSRKPFCGKEHATAYNVELAEYMKRPKKSGGCC